MSDFSQTDSTVSNAKSWAAESVAATLDGYVRFVQKSAAGTYTADELVKDTTKMMLSAQRDAARMWAVGLGFATALTDLDIS